MPPKAKSRNAPNQHDKRHENGLAPPGKRVTKQRSNGQLNGHPNGKSASAISPPALPASGLNQGFKFPRPLETSSASDAVSPPTAAVPNSSPPPPAGTTTTSHDAAALAAAERARTNSDASIDDLMPFVAMSDQAAHNLDARPATATSPVARAPPRPVPCNVNRVARPGRTLYAISTVLTYYPLRDAIAILILLLSLPPTLVLVIQALFASLTFVPPSAGLSLSTLPSVKDIFSSSNMGLPALYTILSVDFLFWICWANVWTSVQNICLDLSQAVIAVSLSGATATSGGQTYSIATCSLVVCIVHVLRYKAIHLTALDYLRSIIDKFDLGQQLDWLSLASSFHSFAPIEHGALFTWIRSGLGIHIVSQGVTTCIRRSLVKANERDPNGVGPHISRHDPEAAPSGIVDSSARSTTNAADGSQPSHTSLSSTDGRPPGLPPAHRENRMRELSSKKKRKQANLVRSQQPLWAAIASTKVTFVKEMEQRDAVDDAREAVEMYTTTPANSLLGGAAGPMAATLDRIWVYEVRDTEAYFYIDLSPESAEEQDEAQDDLSYVSAGIDRTKPFFIRVNGAAWSSARIANAAPVHDEGSVKSSNRYVGEVFGLAPLSSYQCEVVGMGKHQTLCSVSLITQPAPTAEQAASSIPPPHHPALRPSSPITTLKQSIASAEVKLAETRNRAKKNRKDHRAAHADIKKEINSLRQKLEASGGVDDKARARLHQINQHRTSAEETTAQIRAKVEGLGEIPADELKEAEALKQTWQSALDARDAANDRFSLAKTDKEREMQALRAEITAAETKKEKLVSRNTQRTQELENLSARQQAETALRQKREQERAQITRERERKENELRLHAQSMLAESQVYHQKTQEVQQLCASLSATSSAWSTSPLPPPPTAGLVVYQAPTTPEGMLPGSSTHGSAIIGSHGSAALASSHALDGYAATSTNPAPLPLPFPQFGAVSGFSSSLHPSSSSNIPSTSALAPSFLATTPNSLGNASLAVGQPPIIQRGRSSSMLSQYSGFTDTDDLDYLYPGAKSAFPHSMAGTSNIGSAASASALASDLRHQGQPWPLPTAVSAPSVLEDSRQTSESDNGFNAAGSVGANGYANGASHHTVPQQSSTPAGLASPRPEAKPFVPGAAVASKLGAAPIAATTAIGNAEETDTGNENAGVKK